MCTVLGGGGQNFQGQTFVRRQAGPRRLQGLCRGQGAITALQQRFPREGKIGRFMVAWAAWSAERRWFGLGNTMKITV